MDRKARTSGGRSLWLIADMIVGVMVAIASGQALWSIAGYVAGALRAMAEMVR